ncbi:MAG: putativetranscriptional regulator [Solirubrobacterales bacterium]|nr:putativetranscriptional regulator [Solirubrobacterales bacterium]
MATGSARSVTTVEVLAGLRRRQRELVDAYMRELVPDYPRFEDRLADMREAGELVVGLLVRALSEQRPITPGELDFARSYIRRALLRGATEGELIRAARLWQRVLWDAIDDLAGPGGRGLVADLSRQFIDLVDALSSTVYATVEEIQAALRLTAREGRGELVEDLLAGRPIAAGSKLDTARACGLDGSAPVLVISARPVEPFSDPTAGSVAAVALAHATGDAIEPLFTLRADEIVIVRTAADDPARLVEALAEAQRRLARDGVTLAIGVSAIHDGPAGVPAAHAEASVAREHKSGAGGLMAIPVLTPLDYLFMRGADQTAWNLVAPAIRTFIEQDQAQAGLLVGTLMAYVDCSLNVKLAAEQLFVHTNTAHYRLAKIEELTGRDLRDLTELQELVVAIRLAHARARR